jgi:5-formyltetrahydrofolate cyclo-ligase
MAAPHISSDLNALKAAARARALAARAGCDPAWGARLAEHVLRHAPPPADAVVAGFWPLAGEIDIRPLMHALAARGHAVLLPETPARGLPLGFRRWRPGDAMAAGRFGTPVPVGEAMVPSFLLVPLLAFDRRGHRLGYGAGYYDCTLAALHGVVALGCGFAAQELDSVPVGPQDVSLAAIATERGIIACDTASNEGG